MRVIRSRVIGLALLAAACGGGAETEAPPAKATSTPAADPHAGHGAAVQKPAADGNAYDIDLRIDPPPAAGVESQWILDPRTSAGQRVGELAIAHEKPLHLLLVSGDLSFFAHEHPAPQADGTLALHFAFPFAGEYLAFADFTPKGATQQVVRKPITVTGETRDPRPLVVDDRAKPKAFGEYQVALSPARVAAGGSGTMLEFTIQRGDQPVQQLEPYLGAMGHCVVISADTTEFLHSHPREMQPDRPNVVGFHTAFPKPGIYKVWGQFDVGPEILVADFVVDVADGPAQPAADPHANHH